LIVDDRRIEMHNALIGGVIASIRKRVNEGQYPAEMPLSIDQYEETVLPLLTRKESSYRPIIDITIQNIRRNFHRNARFPEAENSNVKATAPAISRAYSPEA
jgi:sigma54-dependent transcription regulator